MIKVAVIGFLIGIVPAMAQDDTIANGEKVYRKCKTCHTIGPPTNIKMLGPHLNDLFGRKPGSLPDQEHYSEALIAWGQDKVWDETTLTMFLRDPTGTVEGTNMQIFGLESDEDIKAILAYMATFDSGGMVLD